MAKGLSVILGCDPLLGPMTGIGNYTKQLGLALQQSGEIDDLKLFAHAAFFPQRLLGENAGADSGTKKLSVLAKARAMLAGNKTVVTLYELLMPYFAHQRIKPFQNTHVMHSPNFVLPRFDGPSVVTFHDLSPLLLPNYHPPVRSKFVSREMSKAVNCGAHIITDTEYVKREIINYYGVAEDKVTAIHLAADSQFRPHKKDECVEISHEYGLQFKDYFLFVSTIEPRKNLLRMLQAFERYYHRSATPRKLVIVGGKGWNSSKEHEKINALAAKGMVKYLGYVQQNAIYPLYAGARALLFASEYEGFGLPVLEAMQSGTAVLTSSNSAMSEVSSDAALLCDYQDVEQITDGIERLNEDDAFRGAMEFAGQQRAKEFSWERCAAQTIAVYKGLI